jgi:hypothetical protein
MTEHFRLVMRSVLGDPMPWLVSRAFHARSAALYWGNAFEFHKPAYLIRVRPK